MSSVPLHPIPTPGARIVWPVCRRRKLVKPLKYKQIFRRRSGEGTPMILAIVLVLLMLF